MIGPRTNAEVRESFLERIGLSSFFRIPDIAFGHSTLAPCRRLKTINAFQPDSHLGHGKSRLIRSLNRAFQFLEAPAAIAKGLVHRVYNGLRTVSDVSRIRIYADIARFTGFKKRIDGCDLAGCGGVGLLCHDYESFLCVRVGVAGRYSPHRIPYQGLLNIRM